MTQTMLRSALFLLACCSFSAAVAKDLSAQTSEAAPVVVELFTSQGCVSCPPADEFFAELVKDPDVIGLSLHVDYWDYIGWEDHFAQADFTARQKAYARVIGSRTIYTPQFIIDGRDRIEGNDQKAILNAVNEMKKRQSPVSLRAERHASQLQIKAAGKQPISHPLRLDLVRYTPEVTVQIERGENEGKVVTYHNIVTSWQPIAEWDGQAALELDLEVTGDEPAVVIMQEQGPAKIIAAALVDTPKNPSK